MSRRAFGTSVSIDGTDIGGLTSYNGPEPSPNIIDTTAWDTEGGYRTKTPGLIDPGTATIGGKSDPSDPGQAALIAAVGTTEAFVVTFPDGKTESYSAIVGGYSVSGDDDGDLTFSVTLTLSGAIAHGGGGG